MTKTVHAIDLTGLEYHHEPSDVEFLKRLVGLLPENPVVVNIGARFGTSTLAMLEARKDVFVFSVDINPCPEEREHLEASSIDANRCVRVLGQSQEAGVHWPHQVDMVFVDGAHHREAVIGDIEVWLPRIKQGGIIAFDDYGKKICAAVKPAVDDSMGEYAVIDQVGDMIAFWVNQ